MTILKYFGLSVLLKSPKAHKNSVERVWLNSDMSDFWILREDTRVKGNKEPNIRNKIGTIILYAMKESLSEKGLWIEHEDSIDQNEYAIGFAMGFIRKYAFVIYFNKRYKYSDAGKYMQEYNINDCTYGWRVEKSCIIPVGAFGIDAELIGLVLFGGRDGFGGNPFLSTDWWNSPRFDFGMRDGDLSATEVIQKNTIPKYGTQSMLEKLNFEYLRIKRIIFKDQTLQIT